MRQKFCEGKEAKRKEKAILAEVGPKERCLELTN